MKEDEGMEEEEGERMPKWKKKERENAEMEEEGERTRKWKGDEGEVGDVG